VLGKVGEVVWVAVGVVPGVDVLVLVAEVAVGAAVVGMAVGVMVVSCGPKTLLITPLFVEKAFEASARKVGTSKKSRIKTTTIKKSPPQNVLNMLIPS
jgi:hypothetical protein